MEQASMWRKYQKQAGGGVGEVERERSEWRGSQVQGTLDLWGLIRRLFSSQPCLLKEECSRRAAFEILIPSVPALSLFLETSGHSLIIIHVNYATGI